MASDIPKPLPPLAPFPEPAWRAHLVPHEWAACLDAWIVLVEAHLSLSSRDFAQSLAEDKSLVVFVASYVRQKALLSLDANSLGDDEKVKRLHRGVFFLIKDMLESESPPEALLNGEFLADIGKVYGKSLSSILLSNLWENPSPALVLSLGKLKSQLTNELEAGLKGKPTDVAQALTRLNHLLYASPDAAILFMSGSDFLDGLISCYKVMNPPLRKAIISTTYLCLIGLTEGERPSFSLLIDQLYSLKAAAEAHKAGPTNVNDSLVAELVTATPILKQVKDRIGQNDTATGRANPIISSLEDFRKPNAMRPKRNIKRRRNKGKDKALDDESKHDHETAIIHVHRISAISQVQDLFPDLGSAFIVKLLDEYNDNVEEVISHLLEGSLPPHLATLDRTEVLPTTTSSKSILQHLSPRTTPPLLPSRRNIFDDDEFDQLAVSTSRLHFGRKDAEKTADDILRDRSTAPNAAAILAALAAFDSDDDERDDTYDAADVGGAVDANNTDETRNGNGRNVEDVDDVRDEALFKAWKMNHGLFGRDAATRRGSERASLKQDTGMTDEAIEGWALMLSRDPHRHRILEAKFSSFSGQQDQLVSSSWRADSGAEGTEGSDADGGDRGRGRFGGRGRGGARGRGRGFNVAGPPGQETDRARERKGENKGRGANHNRRDQRARKVARSGFPG